MNTSKSSRKSMIIMALERARVALDAELEILDNLVDELNEEFNRLEAACGDEGESDEMIDVQDEMAAIEDIAANIRNSFEDQIDEVRQVYE